jgi:hypothetical protein
MLSEFFYLGRRKACGICCSQKRGREEAGESKAVTPEGVSCSPPCVCGAHSFLVPVNRLLQCLQVTFFKQTCLRAYVTKYLPKLEILKEEFKNEWKL